MREIQTKLIQKEIYEMCRDLSFNISPDVKSALEKAYDHESVSASKDALAALLQNACLAKDNHVPLCQDTGLVTVFLKVGQDVTLVGGNIKDAVNQGVHDAYGDFYLRKSIVKDPLNRENTKTNTPAIIYFDIVPGENVEIFLMAKGFGSENMSQTKMLTPADGRQGIIDFVIETVVEAGPNPCPPIVVGVGVGGSLDKVALLAKESLFREIGSSNPSPLYADLEIELLEKINSLGIGTMGFKGDTTALSVMIEEYPTHIAGLPVAVNICCHSFRRAIKKL